MCLLEIMIRNRITHNFTFPIGSYWQCFQKHQTYLWGMALSSETLQCRTNQRSSSLSAWRVRLPRSTSPEGKGHTMPLSVVWWVRCRFPRSTGTRWHSWYCWGRSDPRGRGTWQDRLCWTGNSSRQGKGHRMTWLKREEENVIKLLKIENFYP